MYQLKWRMTNRCNFRCDYCVQGGHVSMETADEEQGRILLHAELIRRLIEDNPQLGSIYLSLIGGEVTLIDRGAFLRILGLLFSTGRVARVQITTNFSASPDYYEDVARLCAGETMLVLTASLHEQYWDVEKFLEKARLLNTSLGRYGRKVSFRIEHVITHQNMELSRRLLEFGEKSGIKIHLDYNRKEKWERAEKVLLSTVKAGRMKNIASFSEDTFGYSCSDNLWTSNISPDGYIYGIRCYGSKPYGYLGLTKRIEPMQRTCLNHGCSLCGDMRITRPDGTVYFDCRTKENR